MQAPARSLDLNLFSFTNTDLSVKTQLPPLLRALTLSIRTCLHMHEIRDPADALNQSIPFAIGALHDRSSPRRTYCVR